MTTQILASIEIINPDFDQKSQEYTKPVLYIGRGFSEKAAANLRKLIIKLNLCSKYIVIVPLYSDAARLRQKAAVDIKKDDLALSKEKEYDLYVDCADQLSHAVADLNIKSLVVVGLSAGASIAMYMTTLLTCSHVTVTSLHVFAPDPLPATTPCVPSDVPTHLYWQICDPMIPLVPNCIKVMDWLGPAFRSMVVVPGNEHEFDEKTLCSILETR